MAAIASLSAFAWASRSSSVDEMYVEWSPLEMNFTSPAMRVSVRSSRLRRSSSSKFRVRAANVKELSRPFDMSGPGSTRPLASNREVT
jgi:hypothetical protein